jgi:hypothetical protein
MSIAQISVDITNPRNYPTINDNTPKIPLFWGSFFRLSVGIKATTSTTCSCQSSFNSQTSFKSSRNQCEMIKLIFVTLAVAALTVEGRYFDLVRTPQKDRIYDPSRSARIILGDPAEIADFPHMLALLDLSRGG